MLELDLPYPPSANRLYRRVGPRTLISREGRRYRERVAAILRVSGVRPIAGRLDVVIAVHPPDRRRRDIDNLLKGLLDALQHGGAFFDDSQVGRIEIERREVVNGGRINVLIRETD